ncbi:MAG: glycosyltransferase family 2 protein [Candidatus Marinimicrobia bacterium]|nr:glycosyltransferase family 2 protein [Candidatus Neomarinimicrobiota bacterium]
MMETETPPIVSIGMVIYNEEQYIREALDSLISQDFKDFELIISDNASLDSTQQICLDYASRDNRIRYYRNDTNIGAIENFNRVFKLSSGKYFMWAGGHDLWSGNYISDCLEIMEKNPNVIVAYPKTIWIDENAEELNIKSGFVDTQGGWVISRFIVIVWTNKNAIYGLIRSESLDKTKLMRRTAASDELLLAELSLFGDFAHAQKATWYRRINRKTDSKKLYIERCFSTNKKFKFRLPYWRLCYEYTDLIWKGPITLMQKLALTVCIIPSIFIKYKSNLFYDILHIFK